jgi:hypothetical protein
MGNQNNTNNQNKPDDLNRQNQQGGQQNQQGGQQGGAGNQQGGNAGQQFDKDRQKQGGQPGRQIDDNQDDMGRDVNDPSKSGNDVNKKL